MSAENDLISDSALCSVVRARQVARQARPAPIAVPGAHGQKARRQVGISARNRLPGAGLIQGDPKQTTPRPQIPKPDAGRGGGVAPLPRACMVRVSRALIPGEQNRAGEACDGQIQLP